MDMKRMEEQLVLHEGLRLSAYLDTEDFWTVGVGYNLSARGVRDLETILGRKFNGELSQVTLTRDEALQVLRADIKRVAREVEKALPIFNKLNEVRQRVCVDMAFNMGTRALGFKKAIEAAGKQDWSRVARELYASKWARQVDDGEGKRFGRADRLVHMVLTGLDYTR